MNEVVIYKNMSGTWTVALLNKITNCYTDCISFNTYKEAIAVFIENGGKVGA